MIRPHRRRYVANSPRKTRGHRNKIESVRIGLESLTPMLPAAAGRVAYSMSESQFTKNGSSTTAFAHYVFVILCLCRTHTESIYTYMPLPYRATLACQSCRRNLLHPVENRICEIFVLSAVAKLSCFWVGS